MKTNRERLCISLEITYAMQVQQSSSNSKQPVVLQKTLSLCDMPQILNLLIFRMQCQTFKVTF